VRYFKLQANNKTQIDDKILIMRTKQQNTLTNFCKGVLLLEAQTKGSASLRSVGDAGPKQTAEQLHAILLIDVFLYRSCPAVLL